MQPKFLKRRDAAQYLTEERGLPTSWRTLQKLASVGGGPLYQRYGIHSLYTPQTSTVGQRPSFLRRDDRRRRHTSRARLALHSHIKTEGASGD
jgi:hypothetical protein